jgi:hypothetical protein
MSSFPFFQFRKWIKKEELWEIVDEFARKYWPEGTVPVDTEMVVEQRLGLNIEPMHSLLKDLDVDALLRRDLTGIIVDYECYMEEKFRNRVRFSFAHEIGHYILHKDIIQQIGISTCDEWKKYVLELLEKEYRGYEWQANEFAGRLLVPRKILEKEIRKTLEVFDGGELIEHLKTDPEVVLAVISLSLAQPFGVSEEVIERRIEREALWPPNLG